MTSPSSQSPDPSPGLSTADRDELAVAALHRMKPFERKVLGLIYGLRLPLQDVDGATHTVAETAKLCKCSAARLQRVLTGALGKVAATIDLEPVQAGRHLFRLGVHWSQAVGVKPEAVGMQFTPIDRPNEPGWWWYAGPFYDNPNEQIPHPRPVYVEFRDGRLMFSPRMMCCHEARTSYEHVFFGPQIPGPPPLEQWPSVPPASPLTPQASHDLHPESSGIGIEAAHAALGGPG